MSFDTFEPLSPCLRICVTPAHKFGTDAFLLSDFAAPRCKDITCDLGSGCGIIPALWFRDKNEAPKAAYAVELQEQAVRQMQESVKRGGLPEGRFIPIQADLRQIADVFERGSIHLVTCNPPYKAAGRGILSESEADKAARHETSCSIEDVCNAASYLLNYGGRLCICHRPERLADVISAMKLHKIEPKRLRFIQQRPEKAPWLFLIEGRKGGKPFLQVEAPLFIEGEGGFSAEILRIYRKEKNL